MQYSISTLIKIDLHLNYLNKVALLWSWVLISRVKTARSSLDGLIRDDSLN